MKYAAVIGAVILAVFVRAFLVSVYKVPSQTMAPSILSGDFVLASQVSYGLRIPGTQDVWFKNLPVKGELVAFVRGGKIYIKRTVANGGDDIEYHGGELSINSQKCGYNLEKSDVQSGTGVYSENCGGLSRAIVAPLTLGTGAREIEKTKVPTGSFFVFADNRTLEMESPAGEIVEFDQIIGKPLFIWMSYSSTQDFISGPLGIRWNRILTKL